MNDLPRKQHKQVCLRTPLRVCEQTMLLSYFPSGLVSLIYQAALIKSKVVQDEHHTYVLTAKGQVFRSLNDEDGAKFTLWHKEPVRDIFVDQLYHDVTLITLDARILHQQYTLETTVVDVISVASYGSVVTVITSNGDFYTYDANKDSFILTKLPEPVVDQVSRTRDDMLLLLRMDGRVWIYEPGESEGENIGNANDVEDVVSLSDRVLLRTDGKIYELFGNSNLSNYKLNNRVSNIISVDSGEDGTYLHINLITRSGQALRKLLTEKDFGGYLDNQVYKPIMLGSASHTNDDKVVAITGETATVILDNGRVVQSLVVQGNDVMATIPRFNVFNHYK